MQKPEKRKKEKINPEFSLPDIICMMMYNMKRMKKNCEQRRVDLKYS